MSKPSGISGLKEFRAAADVARAKRAEEVKLPSGLTAWLVRPTSAERFFIAAQLPEGMAAAVTEGEERLPTTEEAVALAARTVDLVRLVFLSPRVPDEARPGIDIPIADIEWALKWAAGQTGGEAPAGDLASFRVAESAPAAAPGGDRRDLERPALATDRPHEG